MSLYSPSVLAWLEENPQPDWVVKYPAPPLPDVRTTRYNFVYFGTYRDMDVWWDSIKGTSVRAYKGDIMGFTQFGDNGENVKYWIDIWAYNNWRREQGIFVPPTPLIPTGYTYSGPPDEIPEPPWPFNWIKGVFQGADGIVNSIGGGLGSLAGGMLGIGTALLGLPTALVTGLIENAGNLWQSVISFVSASMAKDLTEGIKGTPPIIQQFKLGWTENTIPIAKTLAELSIPQTYLKPAMTPSDVWIQFQKLYSKGFEAGHSAQTMRMVSEIVTAGQCEFATDWIQFLKEVFPAWNTMSLVSRLQDEKAWLKPIEHYLNQVWEPEIPPYTDLINMRVKEKITDTEFRHNLSKLGFSQKWSGLIWDAHFQAPSYGDIVKAYYRGAFSYERLVQLMERVDLDPEYNEEVFLKLIEEIPPYSELVNQRVKEVLTQEEFDKYIKYYGFDPVWSKRIWDAHFTPAAFADFLTAMRRKETVSIPVAGGDPISHTFGEDTAKDAEIIKNLSILADYDPRYWSFFKTRIYNDPTPRMARWAFEVGALTPEQVKEVVHRFGYRPEDEEWFTDMLVGFQERPWVTKYLTAISTAYISGAITEKELKKRVVNVAGRNEKVAEWIVEIANVKREIGATGAAKAPKLLGISDLKKAFLRDKINEDVFRRELGVRGYDVGDVDILVQLLEDDKTVDDAGGRVVALSITQMLNAWRYNVIGEDELRTKLMLRGLSQEEVQQLIDTKKRQWGVSPPS